MNTDINTGSRVLNPDGDLCVVTGMKNETAGNRSWWVSIIPGRLSLLLTERVSITRRWYDEENLRLLVPLPKRSEPGKPPVDPFLELSYAAWRIGYQSSEAAARAAFFKLASGTQTAPAEEPRESLRVRLQQKCSDWGTYWRASDAHGVNLTQEQALELLRDALGVEVEFAGPAPRPAAVPDVLFDGAAVYWAMTPKAKARTNPENVSDTLDAVVRILRENATEQEMTIRDTLPAERECCGTFPGSPHRVTCPQYRGAASPPGEGS